MPFVSEYNNNLVLKKMFGEIPNDIAWWEPYNRQISFLNRLDKINLRYFKEFCENPKENFAGVYEAITVIDNNEFVYEGSSPSYHKYQNCDRLSSNFVNYKVPNKIKEKGEVAIYRAWFKENASDFSERPDNYQKGLLTKFGIVESLQTVNYVNSGNVYKENLTIKEIELRIDSLLDNALKFFNRDEKRKKVILRFQTATFLAFKKSEIENNDTGYSDDELKSILRLYHKLFVEPIIYYLREYFRTIYNANIEVNEKIFRALNFKKCGYCYSEGYEMKSHNLLEKKRLKERFGDFEFPIEPTKFYFKQIQGTDKSIAFIYCRVFELINDEFKEDKKGKYKTYKVEYIDHKNNFIYQVSKVYESEIENIEFYKKYITEIILDKKANSLEFITYAFEL